MSTEMVQIEVIKNSNSYLYLFFCPFCDDVSNHLADYPSLQTMKCDNCGAVAHLENNKWSILSGPPGQ